MTKYIVTTNGGFINVRSAPDVKSPRIGQLANGAEFESNGVSRLVGQWHWIQILGGGYVALELVRVKSPATPYITTQAVNLRLGPATTYGISRTLPGDYVFPVYPGFITLNGIVWLPTDGGYVCGTYAHPASSTHVYSKIGVHCHVGVDRDKLVAAAHACWVAGKKMGVFTVIDDWELAVALAQYDCTVIMRRVDSANDYHPDIPQNEPEAIQAGINYVNMRWNELYQEMPKSVYLQFDNERDWDKFDYAFNIGIMQACESRGYKACIFNDGTGNPSGEPWLYKWQARVPAMQRAMAHGHIVGAHIYGDKVNYGAGVSDPVSAYFANRFNEWYQTMPDNARPFVAINEAGTYNAVVPSTDFALHDSIGFAKLLAKYPYVLGFAYWTAGGQNSGWAQSTFDPVPLLQFIESN